MTAQFQTIARRNRDPESFRYAAETDFECVPAGPASFEQVVTNPHVTLYCFDHARQQALFVETPPTLDLLAQPFIYLAQARNASRLVSVPYPQFFEWAERCPTAKQLAMFYSVGRCGSTLLSKLIGGVADILVINEPDALTQVENLVLEGAMTPDEARPFLRAVVRHWWKPALKPGATWQLLKSRHELPAVEELIAKDFPSAKMVFMYRDADEVVSSFMKMRGEAGAIKRLHDRLNQIMAMWGRSSPVDALYAEHGHLSLEVMQWAWSVEQCLAIRARGFDIPAVRYEELVAGPDRVMAQLLEHWGLTWDPAITPRVMAEDSQKATPIARSGKKPPLSAEQREVVRRLLPAISSITSPDTIIAGTLV